jgi:hypothetical protein
LGGLQDDLLCPPAVGGVSDRQGRLLPKIREDILQASRSYILPLVKLAKSTLHDEAEMFPAIDATLTSGK